MSDLQVTSKPEHKEKADWGFPAFLIISLVHRRGTYADSNLPSKPQVIPHHKRQTSPRLNVLRQTRAAGSGGREASIYSWCRYPQPIHP